MNNDILDCYTNFNNGIKTILQEDLRNIQVIKKGLHFCKKSLQELRICVRTYGFSTIENEIYFFKYIKPNVCGYLKFFVYIYKLELNFPIVSSRLKQKYLKNEMEKIEKNRARHVEFYRYYLNKETKLDHFYFVRNTDRIETILDTTHFFSDPEFSTSHDNLFSSFLKYEMLETHLQDILIIVKTEKKCRSIQTRKPDILQESNWTSSKTDLVELIYSLKAAAAVNNGNKELNRMVGAVEELFDLEINNHYKIYQKIKYRSGNPTKFLDQLKTSLLNKIDTEDQ